MKRRLTAILAADVVAYSRWMEADEAGTLAALKNLHRDVLAPLITEHHGRIVKLMGDGALVEFDSVVDAVTCAIAIQKVAQLRDRAAEQPGLKLRIGVHLGDVIVESDAIFGDGVNIAARLEGLAEPGGICLSRQAYDHVEAQLQLLVEDLGEQQLKNISRKVHVYRVVVKPDASISVHKKVADNSLLSDKPVIAVLLFANMSGDDEHGYFVDGITEDIITALSKNADLHVISRNTTFAYKGQSVRISVIGKELSA